MARNPLATTCLALGGFALVLIGCTYGRWEFLSWRYASEFYTPIKQAVDGGCLSGGYPEVIKVMNYNRHSALVWFKGKSGSTWIAKPWRSSKEHDWQFKKEGSSGYYYCVIETINSKTGGSADSFYWYN